MAELDERVHNVGSFSLTNKKTPLLQQERIKKGLRVTTMSYTMIVSFQPLHFNSKGIFVPFLIIGGIEMAKEKYIRKTFTFDGKRYTARGKTEAEAVKKMLQMQLDLEQGKVTISNNMSLEEWWNKYLETYKVGCKEITLKNFKYKLEKRLISELGHMRLKDIKPLHCQGVLNSMQGLSADYIRKVRQGMFDIFEKAVDNKLILENPSKTVVSPQGTKETRRSITEQERKYILDTIPKDPRYVFFAVMLFCGCRPSEVSGLQGMDIDIKNKLLHIRGTKSKNADRYVPIPKQLMDMLPSAEPFEYVFVNRAGKPLDISSRRHLWTSFHRQLNLTAGCRTYRNKLIPPYPIADDLVPYCLRHTYCTDLQKAGVDIRTAQYLMGHSSITITANIYTHTDIAEIEKAAMLIESLQNNSTCAKRCATNG